MEKRKRRDMVLIGYSDRYLSVIPDTWTGNSFEFLNIKYIWKYLWDIIFVLDWSMLLPIYEASINLNYNTIDMTIIIHTCGAFFIKKQIFIAMECNGQL